MFDKFDRLDAYAEELHTSRQSLRLAAKAGKLPGARKIGGRWFVHRATLEKYFTQTLPSDVPSQSAAV